jgi:SAM-dependent methyltransferase
MADMDPRRYYAEHAEREWERLAETPVKGLELAGTLAALDEHLPADGRVLDAGGGPGRYAVELAERGYRVSHLDPTPELVDVARRKVDEAGVSAAVDHALGDVRHLPYPADAFDATCCLGGVLSHVVDAGERRDAAAELRRVTRPGGPVFVSVIGRLGAVSYGIKNYPEADLSAADWRVLEHLLETGDYTADAVERFGAEEGWAEHHAFRVAELEDLLAEAGLEPQRVVALEGIASNLHDELSGADDEAVDAVRRIAAHLRDDRSAADVSEHFLVVARA